MLHDYTRATTSGTSRSPSPKILSTQHNWSVSIVTEEQALPEGQAPRERAGFAPHIAKKREKGTDTSTIGRTPNPYNLVLRKTNASCFKCPQTCSFMARIHVLLV